MLLRCRALLPLLPRTTTAAFSTRRTVDVILMKDAKHVGYQYDQVSVAPGHARNFLIPQRIAVYATEAQKQAVQERLQGEAAATIDKRRTADSVLKVPRSLTSFPSLFAFLTRPSPPAAIVLRFARV